jgi:hypothetical protein
MEQFTLIALAYTAFLTIVGLFVYAAWYTERGEPENQGRTIWDEIRPPRQETAIHHAAIRHAPRPGTRISNFMPSRFECYHA